MTDRVVKLLAALFMVGFLVAAVAFNASKPRVMILHSYHPDYPWTRDVDIGIQRVADAWNDFAVSWYYMDTKKHADKAWLEHAGKGARRAIERTKPHVLIAVDDLAQSLAARHYVGDSSINIVFAGVNGYVEPYGYDDAENVTGIFERKPLRAVKELIQTLENEKDEPVKSPRLRYLVDPSPSMERDRGFVDAYDWSPLEYSGSVRAETFEAWKQMVLGGDSGSDYLLLANYRKLPRSADKSEFVPAQEIMNWTEENSPIPVIGVNVFNVEDGGAIAVGASPFEQGSQAARMAERILEMEQQAGQMPMVYNRQYVVAINHQALERRGLRLPQVYETFARTTATYIGE